MNVLRGYINDGYQMGTREVLGGFEAGIMCVISSWVWGVVVKIFIYHHR